MKSRESSESAYVPGMAVGYTEEISAHLRNGRKQGVSRLWYKSFKFMATLADRWSVRYSDYSDL